MTPAMLALALSALWPQPREAAPAPLTTLVLPVRVEAPAELAAPAALLRRELAQTLGATSAGRGNGTVVRLALAPDELKRPEEYTVAPARGGVLLRAHDVQGAFWAVHTLAALVSCAQRTVAGYEVPVPRLRDWPDTAFRAFMIQGAWTPSADEFKRNLELLARQHVTYFALEFGPQVVLDFDPAIAQGGKLTKQQAKAEPKARMGEVLDEPAQKKSTDPVLHNNLDATSGAGVKISSAQKFAAARALLTKIAAEGGDKAAQLQSLMQSKKEGRGEVAESGAEHEKETSPLGGGY